MIKSMGKRVATSLALLLGVGLMMGCGGNVEKSEEGVVAPTGMSQQQQQQYEQQMKQKGGPPGGGAPTGGAPTGGAPR